MIKGVAEKSFFRKMYPQTVFILLYTLLMQSYGMAQPPPTGLMCGLLASPEKTTIADDKLGFRKD